MTEVTAGKRAMVAVVAADAEVGRLKREIGTVGKNVVIGEAVAVAAVVEEEREPSHRRAEEKTTASHCSRDEHQCELESAAWRRMRVRDGKATQNWTWYWRRRLRLARGLRRTNDE